MAEMSLRRNVYAARGDFGFGDFQSPTGSMSQPGSGGTLSTILGAATTLLPQILSIFRNGNGNGRTMAMPAGFAAPIIGPIARTVLPAVAGAGAGLLGGLLGGNGGELFGMTAERVRPMRNVPVRGPDDRLYWFGHLGKPVLWSGDLAAARRVQRVARRAGRSSLRRRSVRRR